MAIDSIEYNELSALAPSRLGNKSFVDDDAYANLFGSRTAKRNREKRLAEIRAKYKLDAKRVNDCDYLSDTLIQANNELEMYRKTFKGRVEQAYIDGLEGIVADLKTMISKNKCIEKIAQSEAEAQKKETLDILAKTTEDTTPEGTDNTTKYVIYGVGGLIVVIGIIMLIRR